MSATVEAAFQSRRHARLRAGLLWAAGLIAALVVSGRVAEFTPTALIHGLPQAGTYFYKLLPTLRWAHLFDGVKTEGSLAYWFYRLDLWAMLLFETSQMALLATLGGACVACLLAFPAAANLAPNRLIYILCRRVLELFRTVPDIVYALILVWAFGVGPPAGIIAIGLHTTGALGKLFAEAAENADMKPWDGLRAAGANRVQCIRYAILPQILPNMLSYTLLRFEINVRGATVIGFVGAGGIGQELYAVISQNYYEEISAIVVLIILSVSLIDVISEALRNRAVGRP